MSNVEIKIADTLDESKLKSMDDVLKHFSEEEVVEIVKRYINIRFMQKKNRVKQMARLKELKQWGKEQGMWGKKDEEEGE